MRAVDTNVLVRLLIEDDESQARSAEAFIREGAWVSALALAETVWVLRDVYGLNSARLTAAVELLLSHTNLTFQDPDAIASAVALFRERPSLGFSDCLTLELARKAGHLPLGTFDRALAKADGAHRLQGLL
jgi:predicted nucleic-acid-binding protein